VDSSISRWLDIWSNSSCNIQVAYAAETTTISLLGCEVYFPIHHLLVSPGPYKRKLPARPVEELSLLRLLTVSSWKSSTVTVVTSSCMAMPMRMVVRVKMSTGPYPHSLTGIPLLGDGYGGISLPAGMDMEKNYPHQIYKFRYGIASPIPVCPWGPAIGPISKKNRTNQ
jgi:hypothetical protein